jgi:hypothetical protein
MTMAEAMIIDADSFDMTEPAESETVEIETEDKVEKEPSKEEEISIEVEGKGPSVETEDSKVAKLEAMVRELQGEILKVSQQPKVAAIETPKEEKLTRQQLMQILEQAPEDRKTEVMLNIVEYMAEEKTKAVKKEAFEELNQSQWHREVAGTANRVLIEDKDGYIAAHPGIQTQIDEVTRNLRLGDNPAGRLAAYAMIRFGEGLGKETPVEPAKGKELPKGKMDKTRPPLTNTKTSGLTAEHYEMAKKLGVKPETMARFVPKRSA